MPAGVAFEITPEVLDKIEHYAATGLTQEQIAHNLGVRPETISRHKATNEQVAQAIKRGLDQGIAKVTNALFNNATENNNLGAQCFYLKNRQPNHWADRHDLKLGGSVGVFEVIDYTGDDPDDDEDEPEAA